MKLLEQIVIRDCLEILSKNKDGLTWIELLTEIKKINKAISTNSLEYIILNDLIKNKNIECPRPGFYKLNTDILKTYKSEYLLDILNEDDEKIQSSQIQEISNSNLTMNQLFRLNLISIRVLNVCKKVKVNNLIDLHNYIEKHDNFLKIQGCGNKANQDLLAIYNDYCLKNVEFENIENKVIYPVNKNQEIQIELFFKTKIDSLSIRSRNGILNFFKGYPLFNSIKYYLIDNDFKSQKIKNIGEKSIKEINNIAKETINFYYSLNQEKYKNDALFIEDKFTNNVSSNTDFILEMKSNLNLLSSENKINLIENFVKKKIDTLSVRSRNALLSHFNGYPIFSQIESDFFNLDFIKIRNVGTKSEEELYELFKTIKSQYFKILNSPEDELNIEKQKLENIIGFDINDEYFLNKFIEKKLPIASLIKKHFDSIFKLDQKRLFIFKAHFDLFSQSLKNDEIANKIGISKERVRQIRQKHTSDISFIISGLTELTTYAEQYQVFLNEKSLFSLDDVLNDDVLNEIKEVGCTFFLFVLESLFKNKIYTISIEDKVERPLEINRYDDYEKLKKIKGNYIVNKSLINKSDLLNIHNVLLSASSRIQKNDVVIKLSDIIKKEITSEIDDFLRNYIYNEFGYRLTSGYVYVPKNSIKLTYEYIEEALVDLNKLSSLDEIMIQLNEKYPYENFIKDSIRNQITRYKDKFIFERRQTSLYGLKKWEENNKGIKGGTIGKLAYEFINNSRRICHINEIIDYVLKYRQNSSRSSILTILKTGKAKKMFTFFKGGLVDLKDNYKINEIQGLKNISIEDLINELFDYD